MNSSTNHTNVALYTARIIALIFEKFAMIIGLVPDKDGEPNADQQAFKEALAFWEPCVVSALYNFVRKLGGVQNVVYGAPEAWRLLTGIGNTIEAINMMAYSHYRIMVDGVNYQPEDYKLDKTLQGGIDVRKIAFIPEEMYKNLRVELKLTALDPDQTCAAIERFAKITKSSNKLEIVNVEAPATKIDVLNAAAETYYHQGLFYGMNADSEMSRAIALKADLRALTGEAPVDTAMLWARKYLVPAETTSTDN